MRDVGEILKGCRRGKASAQKRLYDLFSAEMYAVCCYYTGSKMEADDIFQEGFIRVFEKIKQYKGEGALGGWMRRIFVNCALERFRRERKIVLYPEVDDRLLDVAYDYTDAVINEKTLLSFVSELPPRYRMVFNLYAIEGYSHQEVAEIMGISEGTSKSNLARARRILQQKLIQHGFVKRDRVSSV